MHDSYTALGGMMPMINMMLGEVAPGGVGSGLYGMLVLAVIAVFVGGLLVGRTPEYLGKKIGPREINSRASTSSSPRRSCCWAPRSASHPGDPGRRRERVDLEPRCPWAERGALRLTSAANNNGSAFAGLTANRPRLNTALGVAMLLGRFVPIVLVLALAGSLAAQATRPTTVGASRPTVPQFVGLLAVVSIIVTALTYFPVLTLGPLAEGLVTSPLHPRTAAPTQDPHTDNSPAAEVRRGLGLGRSSARRCPARSAS